MDVPLIIRCYMKFSSDFIMVVTSKKKALQIQFATAHDQV